MSKPDIEAYLNLKVSWWEKEAKELKRLEFE